MFMSGYETRKFHLPHSYPPPRHMCLRSEGWANPAEARDSAVKNADISKEHAGQGNANEADPERRAHGVVSDTSKSPQMGIR
eukprot:1242240-Pleurochrysis_carterae.AAC.1